MHCQYNESVHQKEQHTSGINMIPSKFRNIVTSGHVISGQARFVTAQLHYFKLLCTGTVRTESRYKCQFGSNSLLFTPFKTV